MERNMVLPEKQTATIRLEQFMFANAVLGKHIRIPNTHVILRQNNGGRGDTVPTG